MTHFPVLYRANISALVEALDRNSDLWNSIGDRTRPEGPHREAPDIWVRYNDYKNIENRVTFNDEHIPVWYPAWYRLPELKPLVFGVMSKVRGEMLGGVLITKVPAGKKVYPHFDKGWHVEHYDKFYIQLTGARACEFCVKDHEGNVEKFAPMPGDVYLFDNRMEHWVTNDSSIDRMTLIVCVRTEVFGRK